MSAKRHAAQSTAARAAPAGPPRLLFPLRLRSCAPRLRPLGLNNCPKCARAGVRPAAPPPRGNAEAARRDNDEYEEHEVEEFREAAEKAKPEYDGSDDEEGAAA